MPDQKPSGMTEDTTPDPTDVLWVQTAAGDADKRIPLSSFATQAELDAEAALARNADNLTSGTVADARIASTIARDSEVAAAYQPLDADLTALAAANNSAVLAATTASFLTADETKLDGIEAGAEVNDTAAEILTKILTVDGAGSGLDADLLDGNSSATFATAAALTAHIDDTADAHDASAISIADAGNDFTATDVEGALAELQSDHEADATALSDHIADTSAAHAASAVSADSTTLVGTGTDVQAVLEELDNGIADHLADTSAAHAASAISVNSATLVGTGTDVQAVFEEIDDAVALRALDADVVHDTGDETVAGVKTFSSAPVVAGLDVGSSDGVTVDTVDWSAVIRPAAGQGGLAIKIPAATYDDGDPSPYTSGEFLFAILEEGSGDATDSTSAGSVLFRLARTGVGAAGVHLAPGFRTAYPAASNCLHIQPYQTDVIPLLIQASSADGTGATALQVNAAGQTLHQVGSVGTPSISFVGDENTGFYATADAIGFVTGGAQRMALTTTLFVLNDGMNFNIGTTNGTKFGTSTSQKIGFYNSSPVAKQTGVAVTAAGIHAALVTLGLIGA